MSTIFMTHGARWPLVRCRCLRLHWWRKRDWVPAVESAFMPSERFGRAGTPVRIPAHYSWVCACGIGHKAFPNAAERQAFFAFLGAREGRKHDKANA
jgi:hypothetical protein